MDRTGEVHLAVSRPPAGEALLIDPVIDYSTFLAGSNGSDAINAVAVDASGSAYVTGCTYSADFPLKAPLFPTYLSPNDSAGEGNAFITKFAPSGSSLVFSTYLGGSGSDEKGLRRLRDGNCDQRRGPGHRR